MTLKAHHVQKWAKAHLAYVWGTVLDNEMYKNRCDVSRCLSRFIFGLSCLGSYYYVQKEVCCEDPIVDMLCVLTAVEELW